MKDTEYEVIKDIVERQKMGIKKYGTTVAGNELTLRQWLQHSYEECLDMAIYIKRTMQEIDAQYSAKKDYEKIHLAPVDATLFAGYTNPLKTTNPLKGKE